MAAIDPLMRRFFVLHARMQGFFRAWDRADAGSYANASPNIVDVEFLRRLQSGLGDPPMDDEALRERLDANYSLLEAFARTWQAIATERYPALERFVAGTAVHEEGAQLDVTPLRLTMPAVSIN